MITAIIFDFSHVLLFPTDKNYLGKLNLLYSKLIQDTKYRFFDHFELNDELLAFIKKYMEAYDLYIFTTGTVQDDPAIKERIALTFKKVYSAENISLSKTKLQSYLFLANDLQKKPEELLFIDDTGENIQAAQKAGLHALQFRSNAQFFREINEFLPATKA